MAYSSSIDTGLAQTPDLTNINTPDKLSYQFVQLYNAIEILAQSIDQYTGNTPNPDPTQWTQGGGLNQATLGNVATVYVQAQGNIATGQLIGIDPATKFGVLANGTSIPAIGLCTQGATSGLNISYILIGLVSFYAAASFTPGLEYYVGTTGFFTAARPAVGTTGQHGGFALTDKAIFWNPSGVMKY